MKVVSQLETCGMKVGSLVGDMWNEVVCGMKVIVIGDMWNEGCSWRHVE